MPTPTQLREGVAGLSSLASRDLSGLWRQADTPAELEAVLRDLLPALIETYGAAAATLAADWYDDTRDEVGARRAFRAIPADIPDVGAQPLVGWALAEANSLDSVLTLVDGGTQRRIANFSRLTVSRSAVADPSARGWKRVGGGSSCDFCSMLLGRGAVYTEASADFEAHDHCNCGAAPAWR
jgi:hypothetical protein